MTYSENWHCDCCGKVHRLTIDADDCESAQDAHYKLFDQFCPGWLPIGTAADGREIDQIGPCCAGRFDLTADEDGWTEILPLFTGVA